MTAQEAIEIIQGWEIPGMRSDRVVAFICEQAARIEELDADCLRYQRTIREIVAHGPTHRPSLEWLKKWRERAGDAARTTRRRALQDFEKGRSVEQSNRLLRRIDRKIREAER